MKVTRDEVLRLARLARLSLADDELPKLEADLSRIVDYVAELGKVDTSEVSDAPRVGPTAAPLRDDEVRVGLPRAAALAAAPRVVDGAFAVPEFVDES
ncbi:MAG: Asp-tRNA(Asn)/Glu-tRNA(Gln) amidotransferase subunit GatC [Polyangiaceae bacterium]|nr:Asp-tRNA(Asn)/Glu-tRNA(Gln) amidotransferase subunit GatC [Polyangiaceae bacterium]